MLAAWLPAMAIIGAGAHGAGRCDPGRSETIGFMQPECSDIDGQWHGEFGLVDHCIDQDRPVMCQRIGSGRSGLSAPRSTDSFFIPAGCYCGNDRQIADCGRQ
nr:hypothetical protein DBT46_10035 [Aerococcus mictus]